MHFPALFSLPDRPRTSSFPGIFHRLYPKKCCFVSALLSFLNTELQQEKNHVFHFHTSPCSVGILVCSSTCFPEISADF